MSPLRLPLGRRRTVSGRVAPARLLRRDTAPCGERILPDGQVPGRSGLRQPGGDTGGFSRPRAHATPGARPARPEPARSAAGSPSRRAGGSRVCHRGPRDPRPSPGVQRPRPRMRRHPGHGGHPEWTDRQGDGRTGEWRDRQGDGRAGRGMDGLARGWTDRGMGGRPKGMDGQA